jgi:hypothetical protein
MAGTATIWQLNSGAAAGGWSGPTTNLTHRWSMEDADVSGTTITDLVGSINGTSSSAQSSAAGPGSHTARAFNGTSHSIALASTPLPAITSAHSVFMWIYGDSTAADKATVFGDFQSAGNGVRFIFDGVAAITGLAGGIAVHIDRGGSEFARQSAGVGDTASLNTWQHIGYTWDGTSTIKLYVNGVLVTDGNFVGSSGAIASNHTIGARGDGSDFHKGRLYNVVTYAAELDATTIGNLYTAQ